jgi:chromosome segregation protein
LDGEERRVVETQQKLTLLLKQIKQDEEREKEAVMDGSATIKRLEAEKKTIECEVSGATGNIEVLAKMLKEKKSDTLEAELLLDGLMTIQAERNVDRLNYVREIEERKEKNQNLQEQKITVEERLISLEDNNLFTQSLIGAEKNLIIAEQLISTTLLEFNEAEDKKQKIQQLEQEARNRHQACEGNLARISAEKEAVEEFLSADYEESGVPILEKLSVSKGYEIALGAALDSDLDADFDDIEVGHTSSAAAWDRFRQPKPAKARAPRTSHRKAAPRAMAKGGSISVTSIRFAAPDRLRIAK